MSRTVRMTWWKLLLVALAIILAVTFIGRITGGFTKDWKDVTLLDRNEDNELSGKYEGAGWKDDSYNVGDGYKLTAKKDGTIIIDGELTGSSNSTTIPLETVTLAAGTYTISGAPNGGNATYYLKATVGGKDYIADFGTEGGTFTLTSSSEVTVSLVLFSEHEFNYVKIQPVLVEGDEPGTFYEK